MTSSNIRIGKRAFLLAFVIIFVLMMVSGVLTRVVQSGTYERIVQDGRSMVVPDSFRYIERPRYYLWRWFAAPFEVLFAPGNITVITIILFLVTVGGAFTVLEQGDILSALLTSVAARMRRRRFLLMALLQLFFMVNASILGIYEALVPLIVFVVPMAHSLGWDTRTGLGMSLLPLAFGFSAAITNPFTIGVAQTIAELPLFSGAWLRVPFFLFVYGLVFLFVRSHARRVEGTAAVPERAGIDETIDAPLPIPGHTKRALIWLAATLGGAVVFIIVTARIPALSILAFPLMAVFFLLGGLGAGYLNRMSTGDIGRSFALGALNMAPGVLLIMMSMSVKHIVDEGAITDTILFQSATLIARHPPIVAAFLIYAVTLVMNFFIGSASAKAFLMMPILVPLADLVGVTRQTTVLAFDFGDGFSNVIYPTNALLLIGLSFTDTSYPSWIRWTIPLQFVVFLLTALFLGFAVMIGYGPF